MWKKQSDYININLNLKLYLSIWDAMLYIVKYSVKFDIIYHHYFFIEPSKELSLIPCLHICAIAAVLCFNSYLFLPIYCFNLKSLVCIKFRIDSATWPNIYSLLSSLILINLDKMSSTKSGLSWKYFFFKFYTSSWVFSSNYIYHFVSFLLKLLILLSN